MSRYAVTSIIFFSFFIGSMSLDGMVDFPISWYVGLVMIYIIITIYGSSVLEAQYFVSTKCKAKGENKMISITFDDGPVPGKTEKVLEILKQYKVESAFFCIGNRVKQHPELVKQIYSDGHVIGNHSYWHGKTFDLLPTNAVIKELSDTNTAIHEVIGLTPKFFRPPYGVTNPMVASAVKRNKFTVVGWSVRSFDTIIKSKAKLFKRVTSQIKGGDIVLFHDYCETTLEILPDFLDYVSRIGLKIVRVDKLLNEKAYE